MTVESASFVDDLNTSLPAGTDDRDEGDNHIRLVKTALKGTFPNADKAFYFPTTAAKSDAYSVLAADLNAMILVSASGAARTISLLAAATAGNGFVVGVKKTDTSINKVTIDPDGSETIDGVSSKVLTAPNHSVWIVSDGSNWHIVSEKVPLIAFAAHKGGSDQAVASSSSTKITFGSEISDQGSRFASSSWTPYPGLVRLSAGVGYQSITAGESTAISIQNVGATNFKRALTIAPGGYNIVLTGILETDGTDAFQVNTVSGDSSYTVRGDIDLTFFEGHQIAFY